MKCVSCEAEINPKWKHAIDENKCPFCGMSILNERLKDLLSELSEVMQELQEFPNELEDWIFSNYSFVKSDKKFEKNSRDKEIIKVKEGDKEFEIEKTPDRVSSVFFKRAEALMKGEDFSSIEEKTAALKEMKAKNMKKFVKQIKSASDDKPANTEIPENISIPGFTKEMLEDVDPQALEEYARSVSSPDINSAIEPDSDYDSEEYEVSEIESLMSSLKPGVSNASDANHKDLMALKRMNSKQASAVNKIKSGKGAFSRS